MATVTTRNLKGANTAQLSGFSPNSSLNFDKVAITIDPEAYMPTWGPNKWGVFEIDITSYSWDNDNATNNTINVGTLDIRVPQFNSASDWAVADHVMLTQEQGTVTLNEKYFVSVNNGMPGPSVFVQPDGSWDLLYLNLNLLTAVNNEYNATLTYTVSYTDLTPGITFAGDPPVVSSNPSDTGTLVLSVDNSQLTDSAYITDQVTDYTNKSGYTVVQLNKLVTSNIDTPIDSKTNAAGDSVPLFAVTPTTTPGFSAAAPLVKFPTRKISGSRNFVEKIMVFAVNNGVVDGNGSTVKSASSFPNFMRVDLMKLPNWPCDDDVSVTLHYALTATVS